MALDAKLMRIAALLDTDAAAAARDAALLVNDNPGHAGAALLLATARRQCGMPDAAMTFAEIASAQPDSATLQFEHGVTLAAQGQDAEACAALERAVKLLPDLADGWRALAALYERRGDPDACDLAYARYALLVNPDLSLAEAHVALAQGQLDAAEAFLGRHLVRLPRDEAALRLLAEIAAQREDYVRSERLFGESLAIAPGYSRARFDLARTLHMQQKAPPMLPLLERLVRSEPKSLPYRSLQASAFGLLGQSERCIEALEALLLEYPGNETLWIYYGNALRTGGRHQDAIAAYRKAAGIRDGCGEAWFCLANLKTFRFTDDDLRVMRERAASDNLTDEDRLQFEFALGKALEDAASYAESFAHYKIGNALRRQALPYDADANARFIDALKRTYTPAFFSSRAGSGCPASDPIFIVGMPRSGSTLVEQILSSHSRVEGTRELPDIQGFALELGLRELRDSAPRLAHSVEQLSAVELRALGERYLDQTRPNRLRGTPHFIDKMPSNFFHVGLIHAILPNARIIDTRRSALACCFSNFKQHFQAGVWFSYSLGDIGRFYRNYVELMQHYDTVLPGRVYRISYERLVSNFEGEVRKLLDHCGLPFEERCLRFHETRRVVQTASSEQVRKPIFSDGLDQWRHYEPWLEELKRALGDVS